MDSILSRVAYLKGLMEGLNIDYESKDGKITSEIVDILQNIAEEMNNIDSTQNDLHDYVESIDSCLNYLKEDLFYDEEDYDNEDNNNVDDDKCDNYTKFNCTHCNETIYLDENMMSGKLNISCPNCHSELQINQIYED